MYRGEFTHEPIGPQTHVLVLKRSLGALTLGRVA
jgi:hypothetical protein